VEDSDYMTTHGLQYNCDDDIKADVELMKRYNYILKSYHERVKLTRQGSRCGKAARLHAGAYLGKRRSDWRERGQLASMTDPDTLLQKESSHVNESSSWRTSRTSPKHIVGHFSFHARTKAYTQARFQLEQPDFTSAILRPVFQVQVYSFHETDLTRIIYLPGGFDLLNI